jgi:hypothetical protein
MTNDYSLEIPTFTKLERVRHFDESRFGILTATNGGFSGKGFAIKKC